MKETIKDIEKWAKSFEKKIAEMEQDLERSIAALANALAGEVVLLIDELKLVGGKVERSTENMRILRRLEPLFRLFRTRHLNRQLERFVTDVLTVGGLTKEYYDLIGYDKKYEYERVRLLILEVIGVDRNFNVIPGAYLDRLASASDAQRQISEAMTRGIVAKKGKREFQQDMANLIRRTKDADGVLLRYWRQYAFDIFNQVHEVANTEIAQSLGLKYFIYQGSVIPTTRDFCRKKAGRVFSTKEAQDWKDDPDLIDKKTKDTYNPLIERGRYNCRHFLNYISNDLAFELRPDLKK